MISKFWDEVMLNVSCGDKDALFIVWMFTFEMNEFEITNPINLGLFLK